jgi:hypothetical protein
MNSRKNGRARVKNGETPKEPSRLKRLFRGLAIAAGIVVLIVILIFVAVNKWPALGANGADLLRSVIGDKAVAGLEMMFNQVQDTLQKWKYQLGLVTPAAAWDTVQTSLGSLTPTIPPAGTATSTLEINTPVAFQSTPSQSVMDTPQPTFTPTPTVWQPLAVTPLGSANGEGIWSAYIQDAKGDTVAYRTFVQPDPGRPYTLVAIVAIDLIRTRLHFVLGSIEPAAPDSPQRSGKMPKADKAANVLLAAFNGGFKSRHGQFGAMADDDLALPPRDGLGTLVIYRSGSVRLGEWGSDLGMSPNVVAFRQNGPLVIHRGEINAQIYNNSPLDWGYTVNDVSPTVRSGVGLSADNKTLYYFCGPSLSMEALAKSMLTAGAMNAIQLDINNYWVLFVKVQPSGSKLVPEPLLPRLMVADIDRYLTQSPRDFFYITSTIEDQGNNPPQP